MLSISIDNREEIEKEYLSLIIHKNEVLDLTVIKHQYLHLEENRKLFKCLMECYKQNGVATPSLIVKSHKDDFNAIYYADLYENVFYYDKAWKEQLKLSEESIIKFYKEDIIEKLNAKLSNKEIRYDDFVKNIKELDKIQLQNNIEELTKEEIKNNIDENKARISFKKFPKLDRTLQLVQGDFLMIGARTGSGKSGFLLNLMNDLMDDYQCIYFNMEMSKSTIYKRILSIESNVPLNYINNPSTYQQQLINNALDKVEKNKIIIEHKASDIKSIKAIVSKFKEKEKHTVLFIDHIGLTKCDEKKSLYEQATEVAKQLRQICLDYDCTVIAASQLNRSAYQSEELNLSMLKDSGEMENSSSKIILLYRDKDSNKDDLEVIMNVDIAKNRDGIEGIIKMNYHKGKQIFKEI